MEPTTFTYSDFLNWYRSKFGSLRPDPVMWKKYVEYIDKNSWVNTYCQSTLKSYDEIKAKLKSYETI